MTYLLALLALAEPVRSQIFMRLKEGPLPVGCIDAQRLADRSDEACRIS
jgi:hypothetical protein